MGTLSVVATPIGNLGDITLRALETLKSADIIACEDTRVTAKLLARYEIQKPLAIFHAHSGKPSHSRVYELLREGKHVALVTDAGTPGISDPGADLVRAVRQDLPLVRIDAIPGPSALAAALSIAGVSGNDFTFLGFLPHKKGRKTAMEEIAASERTIVFYESPHRIEKALGELGLVLAPLRRVTVLRELTKMHEEVVEGSALEVAAHFKAHPDTVRGEFVVVVAT